MICNFEAISKQFRCNFVAISFADDQGGVAPWTPPVKYKKQFRCNFEAISKQFRLQFRLQTTKGALPPGPPHKMYYSRRICIINRVPKGESSKHTDNIQ